MKNKIAILLLFCLVAPVTITFFILKSQKIQVISEVRRRIVEGIDNEELVLLKFTENEKKNLLNWKHAKEFEFDGNMYDIVNIQVIGDTTYYHCWLDHAETKINNQLDHLFSIILGKDSKNKENIIFFFKFFNGFYYTESIENNALVFQGIKCRYFLENNTCISISVPPPVPPPEIG